MADFAYETRWFAEAVVKHYGVLGATALSNGHVRVRRKDLEAITVAPLDTPRIDTAVVESVLASCVPTAIVLISPTSHYDWDAREMAEEGGSTIHTVKELFESMQEPDPRPFVDRNVSYLSGLLETHINVRSIEMICEASMLIRRQGGLGDMIAAIEYEYEFSEAAFVRARKRHPDARMVINANPCGGTTDVACARAESAEVPILGIAEVMGALNLDGERFRRYVGIERR
jgi:hypothetical protein